MRGMLVRFMGVALCATALTGCSALGDDADHTNPPGTRADAPMSANITAALEQAQALRLSGDLPGATHILSQLMLAAPDDSRIVGEYGKLLVQQGHLADAVQFLNRAVQLQPSDWTYYSALGVAYDQMGDRNNARVAYEHGLALKPNEPAILNNYAMSRMLAGDTGTARALMTRAQAGGSTDPKIAANLELLNSAAPNAPVAPPPAPRSTATASTSTGFPPTAKPAQAAPQPLSHNGTQVVMQQVPVDPKAGPVHSGGKAVAANAARPDKKAKPAKDHIPTLRMTADASKP
jgi:Flp pilus assembly protein TadD